MYDVTKLAGLHYHPLAPFMNISLVLLGQSYQTRTQMSVTQSKKGLYLKNSNENTEY
jgi:hypothetical protein